MRETGCFWAMARLRFARASSVAVGVVVRWATRAAAVMQRAARAVWRSIAAQIVGDRSAGVTDDVCAFRAALMLLAVRKGAQSLDFCCSLAYPRVSRRAARLSDRRRSGRYASGSKRRQQRGARHVLEAARANTAKRLRSISCEPRSRRGIRRTGFPYRCVGIDGTRQLLKPSAAAAWFEYA